MKSMQEINADKLIYGRWVNTRAHTPRKRAKQNNHPVVKPVVMTKLDQMWAKFNRRILGITAQGKPGYDNTVSSPGQFLKGLFG